MGRKGKRGERRGREKERRGRERGDKEGEKGMKREQGGGQQVGRRRKKGQKGRRGRSWYSFTCSQILDHRVGAENFLGSKQCILAVYSVVVLHVEGEREERHRRSRGFIHIQYILLTVLSKTRTVVLDFCSSKREV